MQPLARLGRRLVADFAANLNARLADRRTSGRTRRSISGALSGYGSGTGSDDCLAADGQVIRLAVCDARREDFRSVHCSNA